jgi:hypothetical protein
MCVTRARSNVPLAWLLTTLAACQGHNSTGRPGAGGLPAADPGCVPSRLYGRAGELWRPDGRLIDASFAGYHTGIDPLPDVGGPVRRVTEFGARGDDDADDTQAFLDGIARTSGVLLVPAGRYIVSQRLEIARSNFVLRGEGPGKSTLFFPKSLHSLYGRDWSFSGGFITVRGEDRGRPLATVTGPAARGATTLEVSDTAGLEPGDWVRVVQTDNAGSLFAVLHGGLHPGNVRQDGGREVFHHHSRVTAVAGGRLTLERPLPVEVNPSWSPQIRAVEPTTREVGIERLTLEMAGTTYPRA